MRWENFCDKVAEWVLPASVVECKTDELSSKVDAFLAKPFHEFLTVVVTDYSTADLLIPLAMPGDTIIYDIGTRERYEVRNGICLSWSADLY